MSYLQPIMDRASGVDGSIRHTRRLSDKILLAFHQACDQGQLGLAAELLKCCEAALGRQLPSGGDRRATDEVMIAAFERLWFLRHPGAE